MSNYFIFIYNDEKDNERENVKMCRAILISEVIINRCIEDKYPLNTSKLQKILYYMQKEHLKKYNTPIFDEEIIAWKCGPAIKEIDDYFISGKLGFQTRVEPSIVLKESHRYVLDNVLSKYGELSPSFVMNESQKEVAWQTVWNNGNGQNKTIPLELIVPVEERNNESFEDLSNGQIWWED